MMETLRCFETSVTIVETVQHLKILQFLFYLLAPWSRVILEKSIDIQLVKKFPAFYGTRKLMNAFRSARHLSLSWVTTIQTILYISLAEDSSKYYPPIYAWVSQVVCFPQVSPIKTPYMPLLSPYAIHAQPISLFSNLLSENYWRGMQIFLVNNF
jgi:hypothetical protein